MKSQPLVSIITLNYRQTGVTCEFLESCRNLTYSNYEILVCNMKSDEDPSEKIQKGNYPHTTLFLCDRNLGFAGGNNWGMQFAKGEFILLLNNDTEMAPDLIQKMLIPFDIDPKAGAVSPKINFYDSPEVIQYAGFGKMSLITGRNRTWGFKETDKGQFNEIKPVYGAHGAAMMIKREIIDKVGKFPEKFFLYYEEWDWSTRIRKAGYKIYFQGLTTVYHKESTSVGKLNPMKEYYMTRNRILYMRRNSHGIRFLTFSLFFAFFTLPKTIVKYGVKGNFIFLKAFLKGIQDNLRMSSYSAV